MNQTEAIEVLRAAIQGIHAIIGSTETGKAALAATANPAPSGEPVHFYRQIGCKTWIETKTDPSVSVAGRPAGSCFEYRTLYTRSQSKAAAPAVRIPGERDGR